MARHLKLPALRRRRSIREEIAERPTYQQLRSELDVLRRDLIDALRTNEVAGNRVSVDEIRGMPRPDLERLLVSHSQFWYLGQQTGMTRILGGPLVYVDTRDIALAAHLISTGFWEMWVTQAMARCLRPGMLAADVGANVGYYSMLMAMAVGPQGRVFAFEPVPRLAELLNRSLATNGLERFVTVYDRAAAPVSGQVVTLHVPLDRPMNAQIVSRRAAGGTIFEIPTLSLDAVLPERMDFIKIDVEGAEQGVWKGLEQTLAASPDVQIFLEFNAGRYPDTARDFLARIRSFGFITSYVDTDSEIKSCDDAFILAQSPADIMLSLKR